MAAGHRACRSSEPSSRHGNNRGRADLCRGGARGDLRRWDKVRDWVVAEREFLAWRTGLEAARRTWQATPAGTKKDAVLMGLGLAQARSWLGERSKDIPEPDREFIVLSREAA